MTRRDLLQRLLFGLTFLPALAFAPRSLLSSLLFEPDAPVVPPKSRPVNPWTRDGKAVVAMVHGRHLPEMLEEGLRMIGGLERLGVLGRRVLLKPNVVNNRPPPSTTNPAVIGAVADLIRNAGSADVLVADSSGMIRFPTVENLETTGMRRTAEAAGARVLALEDAPWVGVEPAGAISFPRYFVSKPVYEADVFINVPVVKTHQFAHYSCSLKNLVGIVHPRYRPSFRFLSGRWQEQIAELNLAVHPHLTIADATTVMIAGGPTSGTPAVADAMLISGDRVALDVVAVALIRCYGAWPKLQGMPIWQQRQIVRAGELGLGIKGPAEMELLTASVGGDDQDFQRRVDMIRKDVMQA